MKPEDWRITEVDPPKSGIIIVVGSAPSMEDDLGILYEMDLYHNPVIAINDAGCLYEDYICHVASQHIEKISEVREERRNQGFNIDFTGHSIGEYKDVDRIWPLEVSQGSSGLFGVITALKMGYRKVIIAGISLTGNFGEYYGSNENNHPNKHKEYQMFRETWLKIKPHLLGRVRAVSGYPEELLGFPDKDWLRS